MNRLETLYDNLQARPRPEDVAWEIREVLRQELTQAEGRAIGVAAENSWHAVGQNYSSMAQTFFQPTSQVDKTVGVAAVLFDAQPPPEDPAAVEPWIAEVGQHIHRALGATSTEKLKKAERQALGLYKNARWYNKRYRILCRIEDKLRSLARENAKLRLTRIGKSAFASLLTREEFMADPNSACFVAYMAARMSMRSTFTNKGQVRAFDNIAELLLKRCESSDTTRWDVVASVMPDGRVLKHLSDADKGALLSRVWGVLADIAFMLREAWQQTKFNLEAMIVARGDDSTTWNQLASAWNKARDHWIQLLYALGMEEILETFCIGKVMRLMAGDVAAWHRSSGGSVHPDTKVWATLPTPWEVMSGEETCTRTMVEYACTAAGADPKTWTAQRTDRKAVAFKPTPELVHGVEVASPSLAWALRAAGVFSGKPMKEKPPEFEVERDATGAALRAKKG